MSRRLTAEQVAQNFDATAIGFDSLGLNVPAAMYNDAARFVRDNLVEADEQRRERFERWRQTTWGNVSEQDLEWDKDDGMYISGSVQDQFAAWQAALTWHGETEGGGA